MIRPPPAERSVTSSKSAASAAAAADRGSLWQEVSKRMEAMHGPTTRMEGCEVLLPSVSPRRDVAG